ncbi:DUF2531 family protein [Erwinia endophytica]|uniref:HofP DNA utilization family protein n=1 Tax=Erwinia endophytica TaxID=1563158 RepID=UPI001265EE26|nr:HofP DNA utilization family protein [Erwinia endophytica]KAB8312371.1 DUF2531 family protein [Erwinia endophytica]
MPPERQAWQRYLLLLFLFSPPEGQAARDPFQPPETISCLALRSTAPLWRLRDIVGRAEDYRAWLVSPQGKGKLWAQQQWPGPGWQLLKVEALSVTVGHGLACKTPLRITLKGSIYVREAQDDGTVSVVDPHAAARQPGTTVPSVR